VRTLQIYNRLSDWHAIASPSAGLHRSGHCPVRRSLEGGDIVDPRTVFAVLAAVSSPCVDELRDIVLVDFETGTVRVLLDDDPNRPSPTHWDEAGIVVRARDGSWRVDPATGERRLDP
jgi:hypothetical protein